MTEDLLTNLSTRLRARAERIAPVEVRGRILRIEGTMIRATLENARIGEECLLEDPVTGTQLTAEVVGFDDGAVVLAPGGSTRGLSNQAAVIATGVLPKAPAGPDMLGRVINAFGQPLDGGGAIPLRAPLHRDPPDPLSRPIVSDSFSTGVRAIDGMLTMGVGQRMGIFGAAGVGKSTLLSQIIRNSQADAVVLGLIGERGREVREFLERDLGEAGLQQAAVIVATSDRPATERLRAAYAAIAAAEAFRDEGKSVLLLIDSVTRVARAIREIGLAAGEPPVRRGFPPSTFAMLPQIVERAGTNESGAITALYTVLVEGDDDNADPVADEVRSLIDGHIILSRKLAGAGHFPAIDVLRSKSRVMDAVTSDAHTEAARGIVAMLSKLEEVEFLVQVGEYKEGSDPAADRALAKRAAIDAVLRQGTHEPSDLAGTIARLTEVAQ